MNPKQRGRLEDAARRRRNYVRSKAHALAMGATGGVIVLIFGFAGPYGIWASCTRPGGFDSY